MENDHVGDVAESKSRGASALSPFHVFRNLNSSERADGVEVRAEHRQVSGAGKAVLLYVKFEAIGEDAFICLDCSKVFVPIAPDSDVSAQDGSSRRRTQCLRRGSQPIRMRAAIGIDERENSTARSCGTHVTGRTGPGQTSWSKRVPGGAQPPPSEPLQSRYRLRCLEQVPVSRSTPCPSRLWRQASRPLS